MVHSHFFSAYNHWQYGVKLSISKGSFFPISSPRPYKQKPQYTHYKYIAVEN